MTVGIRDRQSQRLIVGRLDTCRNGVDTIYFRPGEVDGGIDLPCRVRITEAVERVDRVIPDVLILVLVMLIVANGAGDDIKGDAARLTDFVIRIFRNQEVDVRVGRVVKDQRLITAEGHGHDDFFRLGVNDRQDVGRAVGRDLIRGNGIISLRNSTVLDNVQRQFPVVVEVDKRRNFAFRTAAGQEFIILTDGFRQRLGHHRTDADTVRREQAVRTRGDGDLPHLILIQALRVEDDCAVRIESEFIRGGLTVERQDTVRREAHLERRVLDTARGARHPVTLQGGDHGRELGSGEEVQRIGFPSNLGDIARHGHTIVRRSEGQVAGDKGQNLIGIHERQVLRRACDTCLDNDQFPVREDKGGRAEDITAVERIHRRSGIERQVIRDEHDAVMDERIGLVPDRNGQLRNAGSGIGGNGGGDGICRAVHIHLIADDRHGGRYTVNDRLPVAGEVTVREEDGLTVLNSDDAGEGHDIQRVIRFIQKPGAVHGRDCLQGRVADLTVRNGELGTVADPLAVQSVDRKGEGRTVLRENGGAIGVRADRGTVREDGDRTVFHGEAGLIGADRDTDRHGAVRVLRAVRHEIGRIDRHFAVDHPRTDSSTGSRHIELRGVIAIPVLLFKGEERRAVHGITERRLFGGRQRLDGQAVKSPFRVRKIQCGNPVGNRRRHIGQRGGAERQRFCHGESVIGRGQCRPCAEERLVIRRHGRQREVVHHRQRLIVSGTGDGITDERLPCREGRSGDDQFFTVHGGQCHAVQRHDGSDMRLVEISFQSRCFTGDIPVNGVPAHFGGGCTGLAPDDVIGEKFARLGYADDVALFHKDIGDGAVRHLFGNGGSLGRGSSAHGRGAVRIDEHRALIELCDDTARNRAGAGKRRRGFHIQDRGVLHESDNAACDRTATAEGQGAVHRHAGNRGVLRAPGEDTDVRFGIRVRNPGRDDRQVTDRRVLQRGEETGFRKIGVDVQPADGMELTVKHAGEPGNRRKILGQDDVRRQFEGLGGVTVGVGGNLPGNFQEGSLIGDFHIVFLLGRGCGCGRYVAPVIIRLRRRLIVFAGEEASQRENDNQHKREKFECLAFHCLLPLFQNK